MSSVCGHSRNQCSSSVIQTINAPLPLVWSLVRRFDNPQAYKRFVRGCTVINATTSGTPGIGSIRHVSLVSGTPATTSTERLDSLDEELHVMAVSIIGGDHRLVNYRSTISLREEKSGGGGGGGEGCKVVVTESFVVDIPPDSNEEDTCTFVKTIIGFNLRTLAQVSEKMARHGDGSSK